MDNDMTTLALKQNDVELAKLDNHSMSAYATEFAKLDFSNPRLRFTRDELIAIAERCPEGTTLNEYKTFITMAMMSGAHPLMSELYIVKYKKKDSGYYPAAYIYNYHWFEREARLDKPDLVHTAPMWYDLETDKWYEVWKYDTRSKVPYAGKMGIKTSGMADYEWVTLRWDERFKVNPYGKPQGEWANQPLHMMEKCLRVKADKLFISARLAQVIVAEEYTPPVDARDARITAYDDNGKLKSSEQVSAEVKARNEQEKRSRMGIMHGTDEDKIDKKRHASLSVELKRLDLTVADAYLDAFAEALSEAGMKHEHISKVSDLTNREADVIIAKLKATNPLPVDTDDIISEMFDV